MKAEIKKAESWKKLGYWEDLNCSFDLIKI